MKNSFKGYVYLALCIILWASIPVASKKILVELDNLQMLFYSTIFSFLVLLLLFFVEKKYRLIGNYSSRDYLNMAFLGFLGTYLYYVLLYGAFALTTAQEGFILAYTWPILVLVLSFFILKEKVNIKKIVAVLICFIGIVIIVTHGQIYLFELTNATGDLLALSGAFVFALFSIVGKKHNFDRTFSALIYFISALIFITITIVLFSSFKMPSSVIWMWIIYNGVLVNGLTYVWWFKALDSLEVSVVSTSLYLTPFISLIYIWLFLGEKILTSSLVGLIIIFIGILFRRSKR